MKTRTNLLASLSVMVCLTTLSCKNQPAPHSLDPTYVREYVSASGDLVFPNNKLIVGGQLAKIEITPLLSISDQTQEVIYRDVYKRGAVFNDKKFWEIAEQNRDAHYTAVHVPPIVSCYLQPNTRVDITCDHDYAVGYPAGASLNALFSIRAWDIKAFIDGGYDTRNPQLWGPTVSWDGTPEITDGVLAPAMTLTNWNASVHPLFPTQCVLLTDRLPDAAGTYSFTVTFTFDDGATAGFTTAPATLAANAD